MAMRPARNEKQQLILEYIQRCVREKGYPPSVREICEAVNLKSTSTVHGHLERLERKGLIRRDLTKPRAMVVVADTAIRDSVLVPLVGKVTAGVPITAVENIEEQIALPQMLLGSGNHFALSVQGDSMIEAGILDGDVIVVRQQPSADNGDVVVAMIDDEATVKAFYKESDHIRLQPRNETMDPIIVKDCAILGRVVSLIRRM